MAYDVGSRLDYLGNRRKEVDYELVTVSNGTDTKTDVTASLGRTEGEELIPGVAVTNVRFQDFIFDWEDLDISVDGVPEYPDQPWTITRANGEIYQVVPMGNDEPPYQFTTPTKLRIRVHTSLRRDS